MNSAATLSPAPVRKPDSWADMPYRDTPLAHLDEQEAQAKALLPSLEMFLARAKSPRPPRYLIVDEAWLLLGRG